MSEVVSIRRVHTVGELVVGSFGVYDRRQRLVSQ